MWNYNKDDIKEEVESGGGYLEKSGVYVATIEDLEVDERKVVFDFEVNGSKTKVFFYYTRKNGDVLDWKARHLNHLLYLNKLTDPDKIQECIGEEVGVFLKAKLSQDGKYINFDIEGFYNPKTGKTAKELKEKTKAEKVDKMKEKYAEEEPIQRKQGGTTKEAEDISEDITEEDFPF